MEKKEKGDCEKEGQVYVWQGYVGKVEFFSFKTFLTRPVRCVALGQEHSLFLTYDDSLFACGSNEHGQLGAPALGREYSFDPVLIKTLTGKDIWSISCGTNHSGCITKDGILYCWGTNQSGQCGRDPAEHKSITSPEQVSLLIPERQCMHTETFLESLDHAASVSLGSTHSVVLSKEGKIWVWGSGPQIGLGKKQASFCPEVLQQFCGKKVISVVTGDSHTIAVTEEQEVKAKQQTALKATTKSPSKKKVHSTSLSKDVDNKQNLSTSDKGRRSVSDKLSIHEDHFKLSPPVKLNIGKTQTDSNYLDIAKDHKETEKASTAEAKVEDDNVFLDSEKDHFHEKFNEGSDIPSKKDTEQHEKGNLEMNNTKTLITKVENDSEIDESKNQMPIDKGKDDVEKVDDEVVWEKQAPAQSFETQMIAESKETASLDERNEDIVASNTERDEGANDDIDNDFNNENNQGISNRVEMRRRSGENQLTASIRSDSSVTSGLSSKGSRSISFLDETGAREYLARQFQDDEDVEPLSTSIRINKQKEEMQGAVGSSTISTGTLMMQTVSSLTSHMTSMTTKALSNIVSVPGKLRLSGSEAANEVTDSNDTLNTSEILELDDGSNENINLDNSALDFTNLTFSDTSANTSQLSLPDSVKSFTGEATPGEATPEQSPAKQRKKKPGSQSSSTESLSLRTIEAKQENLRRRSLSFQTAEDDKPVSTIPHYTGTLKTVIWSWGKNAKGQLGTGDMLDRDEPTCIQVLSDKRIVQVACGSQHSLALSSTGEVYSWGNNESGQLGHSEMSESPAKIQMTQDCCIWDLDAGSEHSIFLMDNAGTQTTKPEVFYSGKHPCKDLYVPIYKTGRLTPLKFVRKAGWIRTVRTGGDNCACIARENSTKTEMVFEVVRYFQNFYRHLHKIVQVYVKRIQISGFFTSLDVYPYRQMLNDLLTVFCDLTNKIGLAYVEITQLLTQGENILSASVFTQYDDIVLCFKNYSTCFEDMVAIGGYEYCIKNDNTTFENLRGFYPELLPNTKAEDKPNHADKFRQVMYTPLNSLKSFSQILSRFAETFEKTERENNLLSSIHLNLEHLIRTSNNGITDAENTKTFWENASSKISDTLRSPNRRLIKDSKTSSVTLVGAGRFSSHNFYLFNDLFIHSQYSSYQSYPLETLWIDTPTAEISPNQNLINVTTPEETLSLNAQNAQIKTEWVVAFNTAINKALSSQKSYSRQTSGDRIHTPVIRFSSHTFTKHAVYKDATYKGFWLNGKVHGSGVMKWPDGKRYMGKFRHGAQTGSGKLIIPKENNTEEVMEGYWKDGKLHGHGKIKYSSGDLYDGYFKDGLRHGHGVFRKGRYLNSASFVYVGEWLYDKKHGYGVMDDILKGEKYMGMWQDDNRHGDGVVVTLDGMYFEGNFQYNKLVGSGLMLTDDNSCYEGEFNGITMLQGKGTLTFPVGDRIEGTFSGTWNQGLKISGVFHKQTSSTGSTLRHSPSKFTPESKSSLYGKLCVKPDRKWEEIFYQCYESLNHSIDREPNTNKAWEQIVSFIVAGKQKLRDISKDSLTARQKLQLSNLDQLEKIPTHSVDKLTIEHYADIVQYLTKAFETHSHPLGRLIEQLVDVFRAAYIGIGAHPRLLFHAVQEIKSYNRKIYKVLRILFPELPKSEGPVHIYLSSSKRVSTPLTESMGFIQRQISDSEEDSTVEVISSTSLLQPILLPKIYPALFDLYALHCDIEDEKCWERIQKLNKQGDMALMSYLGIDQNFWCIEESVFKDQHKRLSTLKDHSYSKAVEVLQQIRLVQIQIPADNIINTAFCPEDKLEVIEKAFLAITQTVQEFSKEDHVWCMDDLFPIFQYVVIRSRIHHLGAEIMFIEDLMETHLEYGELGIMFTTLKACYHQIQNEKMPTH